MKKEQAILAAFMTLEFTGEIWFWRGPAPWYFVTVPDEQCLELKAASRLVTYGWGMIPVTLHIGNTKCKTSLFPKNGKYLVPIKADLRKAEQLKEGEIIVLQLEVAV